MGLTVWRCGVENAFVWFERGPFATEEIWRALACWNVMIGWGVDDVRELFVEESEV